MCFKEYESELQWLSEHGSVSICEDARECVRGCAYGNVIHGAEKIVLEGEVGTGMYVCDTGGKGLQIGMGNESSKTEDKAHTAVRKKK